MDNTSFHKLLYEVDDLYLIEKSQPTSEQVQEPSIKYESPKDESTKEDIEVSEEIIDQQNNHPLVFKGDNLKGVAIIVNYPNDEFIKNNDETFLLKILSAVQLASSDVAIINHNKFNNLELLDLKSINIKTCLVFGVEAMTKNNPKYSNQNLEEITTLYCNDLGSIQSNVEEKKQLWSALQKIFLN